MTAPRFIIDPLSLPSLYVEVLANDNVISRATGFVVLHDGAPHLITNLHVVRGRDTESNELLSDTGAEPDAIQIFHHSSRAVEGTAGVWCLAAEPLRDPDGLPLWFEHPETSRKNPDNPNEYNVDLAALKLQYFDPDVIRFFPLDLSLAETDVHVAPGLPVFIIGYPFGKFGSGYFPIWKTGHVASDTQIGPDQRYFLIDATTRPGMSGAPVIYRSSGMFQRSNGAVTLGEATRLMGVYSGRIRNDAEIGIVWKPQLVEEILNR